MNQSRKLAEQMRPFLRAMEQSINDVRRQRTGEDEPHAVEPDNPEPTASFSSDTPRQTPSHHEPTRPSMSEAPNVNHHREADIKPTPVHNSGEGRPLSYDGSGLQDDDEDRPRLKARPKRSASLNHTNQPDSSTYDMHSRAG